MKILFINSNLRVIAKRWRSKHSFAIEILSAVLKKNGYQTDLFLVEKNQDIKSLFVYIQKNRPQILAFGLTETSFEGIKEIARKTKEKFPKIFIVVGGIYPTLFPEEVIKFSYFDAVCLGEGEYSLLELVDGIQKKKNYFDVENFWFRKGKKIIKNIRTSPVDINLLPLPDKQLFYEKNLGYYQGWGFLKEKEKAGFVLLSRGCPFDCYFCTNKAIKDLYASDYFRLLDPKKAVSQIAYFQKRYHYDYLFIHDDIFAVDKVWLDQFLSLYLKKINLPFAIQLRIGMFDKKTLRKLKKAGCFFVGVGIESGDEKIRKELLNKRFTNRQVKESVKWLKELGFKIGSYNMVGLPGENPKKFLKTVCLNAELNVDRPSVFIFYPYRGTRLYDFCKKEGLFKKILPKNFSEREDTLLELRNFRREDIIYYQRNFFTLVDLLKKRKNIKSRIFYRILFNLYFIPPSSIFFKLTQALSRYLANPRRIILEREI